MGELFKSLDKNGDGRVSYNEFLVCATNKQKLINERNLRVAFDTLDLNGDGRITTEEVRSRFAQTDLDTVQGLDVDEQVWQKLFRQMDRKHAQGVSFAAFRDHMAKLLASSNDSDANQVQTE